LGLLDKWYNREPKKIIEKTTPGRKGMELFFYVFWHQFWEICKLNMIFILFCIPVVTIPTALTAMHRITMYMFMDKTFYTFSDFFETFKAEWKRSSIAGSIYFSLLAVSVFGMYFYSLVINNFVLYSIAMLICALILIAGFYLFPMLAVLDMSLKDIFKNSILLIFIRMPYNILTLLATAMLTLLIWMFLPFSMIGLICFVFAMNGLIISFCAYGSLKKYVIKDI